MRKVDKPLILYGNGKLSRLAADIFGKLDIPYEVFYKDTLVHNVSKNLVAVCVATESYREIKEFLNGRGYEDIVPVWEIIDAYPEVGLHNGWRVSDRKGKSLDRISEIFKDMTSLEQWISFTGWRRYQADSYPPQLTNTWQIKEIKALGPLVTSPLHEGYRLYDVYSRQWTRLFRWMLGAESFEYVRIHAEGLELQTIFANLEWLKVKRPVIGVTVYHSEDGLWRIEKLLIDNLENYNWHFRLHAYMGQVAIFYGIPKEKI